MNIGYLKELSNMERKYWILGIMILFIGTSCTKNEFIKTGVSNGRFDGMMLEYMKAHSYDWDSTVLMIEHAGLESLFDGTEKITFFGPTNFSILRYMLDNGIERVVDMDVDFCRSTLLRHVMKGKMMRVDFKHGVAATGANLIGEGGDTYTMMGGNVIWAYTFKEPYNSVAGMGPLLLHITSIDGFKRIGIASGDIEPDNGVVHSLTYDFTLGEM
jgi:putative lipoprotein